MRRIITIGLILCSATATADPRPSSDKARNIHGPTEYDRRGASRRRSEEGASSPAATDERRTDAQQIGGQTTEAHELSGLARARAHSQAGNAFLAAHEYGRAIAEYEAAYALIMRPMLLYNLGSAFRRRGEETGSVADKLQALEHYRKYLEAEPDGRGARYARE